MAGKNCGKNSASTKFSGKVVRRVNQPSRPRVITHGAERLPKNLQRLRKAAKKDS